MRLVSLVELVLLCTCYTSAEELRRTCGVIAWQLMTPFITSLCPHDVHSLTPTEQVDSRQPPRPDRGPPKVESHSKGACPPRKAAQARAGTAHQGGCRRGRRGHGAHECVEVEH
jgi:hypothetical protein